MRIGVKPGQIGLTIAELRRCWAEAEEAGFDEYELGVEGEQEVGFMTMSMVYFQPVDMAPADLAAAIECGLHPIQAAFIKEDAFQCGFCTPGQIMSMKALLSKNPTPTDEEIMRAVSGNLCRCGAYRHILEAGRIAAGRRAEGEPGGA